MLEFGREHALAVGVGDLLELQGALQRDGVGGAVAQAVQVVPGVDGRMRSPACGGRPSRVVWSIRSGISCEFLRVPPGQPIGEVQEGEHLVGEGLGGRHADLVAAAQRQAEGRRLGQRGADDVGQAEAGHAHLFRALQGVQHILGLAGLADEQAHIFVADGRGVLGGELRRKHGVDGNARRAARSRPSPASAGVVTGAAADEIHMAGLRIFSTHRFARRGWRPAGAAIRGPPATARGSP